MQTYICFDKNWTKEKIAELDKELELLSELQQELSNLYDLLDNNTINGIVRNIDKLETSINATKIALEFYLDAMESKILEMSSYYESVIIKNNFMD